MVVRVVVLDGYSRPIVLVRDYQAFIERTALPSGRSRWACWWSAE